ncbi:hypothetical protein INT43_000334 [Umbelopsis isabellina]|uniref:Uncharacterized protein n=1 Tax=Mortierella isabellina TaxID=91625 RepID=A0A8H7Q338_MORIS|nr:hypothetical protein INT43_000334 [Umbelopsis isabellina]
MPAISISVSEAASIISAASTVLSVTFSMVVVVILLSTIDNKNSVNSWSTIGAMIQNSPWPVILRTDAVRSLKVQASINAIAKLTLIGTFLIALTGIVTPLGLQDIIIDMDSTLQTMSYVKDNGPMGEVTSPRSKYQENRLCGDWPSQGCPGSPVGLSGGSSSVSAQVAANITSTFNSTDYQSPFNIQYRRYTTQVQGGVNNNQPMTIGALNKMQSFILGDDLIAVEGAIVDTTNNPGIGLMQHSFPNEEGESSWSREILWLEPESACVDTNLTVRYQISSDLKFITNGSTVIVDNGGIADLTTIQPSPYKDNNTFIDLAYHAYTGAVWSNLATMRAFNTTRNTSQIGKTYQIYPNTLTSPFPGQLGFLPLNFIPLIANANATGTVWDVSNYIDAYCRGYNATDIQDGTKPLIGCALMLGSPRQLNSSTIPVLVANTTFEQPIYSCASAIRASIQQVNFTMTQPINNSTGFTSLKISRQITNTSTLWAVEKTGMNISSASPYWGPVDPSHTNDPNLIIGEGNFMYLPPGSSDYGYSMFGEVPVTPSDSQGCSVPGRIFSVLKYGWHDVAISSSFDVSGKGDYNLNKLWQNLTASPQNASKVIKLVWTDFMANNVIGTGFLPTATISPRGQSVSYNLLYAIPAFVTLALWLPTIVFALVLLFTKRVTLHELKNAINQTSIGRSVVNMINPTSDSLAKTKKWIENDGQSKIGIKLERSDSGAGVAKFDYDPTEQTLHQVMQSLRPAVKSGLRSRSAKDFSPLEDVDDKAHSPDVNYF